MLNTAFLQDVADNVLLAARHAEADAGIAGYAAFGPPGSEAFFYQTLPPAIGLIEAWLPNFGDCLLHTIEEIFARGHRSAVVLNSDSPTLPTAFLIVTAEALARPGDRALGSDRRSRQHRRRRSSFDRTRIHAVGTEGFRLRNRIGHRSPGACRGE